MKKYLTELTPVAEVARIVDIVPRISEVVEVPTWEAVGMVLAEDAKAPIDVPPAPRAAYDGYAIPSSEAPGRFRVVAKYLAGEGLGSRVGRGEAAYVAVGAYLPEGTDAVVPEEEARVVGDYVEIPRPVKPWENVDPRGSIAIAGSVIRKRGTVLGPVDVAALLDVGVGSVLVYRRVRVAIIATGNEVIKPSKPSDVLEAVKGGRVVETSASLVEWLLRTLHPYTEVVHRSLEPDDPARLSKLVTDLLTRVDVIITTGGTGPSETDAFYQLGIEALARGFEMRPGKPTSIALIGGKPLIALSGFPTSAMHGFLRVASPIIAAMANAATRPAMYTGLARFDGEVGGRRAQMVRVVAEYRGAELWVRPVEAKHHSFSIDADGVALLPPGGVNRGEIVEVLLWRAPR